MCSPCPKLRIVVIFVKKNTETFVRTAIRFWDISQRRQTCNTKDHCDLAMQPIHPPQHVCCRDRRSGANLDPLCNIVFTWKYVGRGHHRTLYSWKTFDGRRLSSTSPGVCLPLREIRTEPAPVTANSRPHVTLNALRISRNLSR